MDEADKPLAHLSVVEKEIKPPHDNGWRSSAGDTNPEPRPEPQSSTHERLLAFERKHLGDEHPRHAGHVEKGFGSPFSNLSPAHKAHHAALEALIEAEKEHAAAEAHMGAVHARLEAAVKRATDTEEAL